MSWGLMRPVRALLLGLFLALAGLSPAQATITTTAYAQTFQGNGLTVSFQFGFIAGTAANISVTYTDAGGTQTVLSPSAYSLVLNPPISPNLWGVGGTVVYNPSSVPIALGTTLTVTRFVPYTQATSISNQAYYPQAIEQALDKIVMQTQQLSGTLGSIGTVQAAHLFLGGPTSGGAALPTFRRPSCADLSDAGAGCGGSAGGVTSFNSRTGAVSLTAADVGAVVGTAGVSHQWFSALSAGGAFTKSQPAFTDISGLLGCSQAPAFTGDVTNSSCALTIKSSVALAGSPTTTTQAANDNSTKIATTNYVDRAVGAGGVVSSVFGRTGVVVAASNDYSFSQLSGSNSAAQIAGSAASHAVPVDVAGTPTWKVVPDCQDSGGNHINYTQSSDVFSCGTSGGGGAVSVTAADGGIVVTPSPGTGTFTIGTSAPNRSSGSAITFTSADFAGQVNSTGTTNTATIPVTGTLGANQTILLTDQGSGIVTITDSQTVNGLALATKLHSFGFYAYTGNGSSADAFGFPGFDTITTNALPKFSDGSGATTASTVVDNGGVVIGSPTGGAQGAGTLNTAGGIFINGLAVAQTNVSQSFTAGQAVTPTASGAQGAGGTYTMDFSTSNNFTATFGAGNLTIANPSNIKAGECGFLALTQDGTGSRTATWGADFKWAGGTAPTLSTAASSVDLISWCAVTTSILAAQLAVKGYQ